MLPTESTFPQPLVPTIDDVRDLVARAFPRRSVEGYEELSGGLCNTNLKVDFASHHEPVVLRIYRRRPSSCAKEVALLRLLRRQVPVPEVFHAQSESSAGSEAIDSKAVDSPFAILEYIEGLTFQQLKRTNDLRAIQEASYSVGRTLAAIGRYQFEKPGRLFVETRPSVRTTVELAFAGSDYAEQGDGELKVGAAYIEGQDPIPRLLDTFLDSEELERRTDPDLARRLHEFVWSWAPRLRELKDELNLGRSLVHSDFGARNILVRQAGTEGGKWVVAGVIDWEFAFSGSPLIDVANFLRYERRARPLREPHFSHGFVEYGGKLPKDWQQVVRVIDLTALCEMLTRDVKPDHIVIELLDLIQATLDDRDPS